MADKTYREQVEGSNIDPDALKRFVETFDHLRAVEAKALAAKADEADEEDFVPGGLMAASIRHGKDIRAYAETHGISEAKARGLLACRSSIGGFKFSIAEQLGCDEETAAEAKCLEIAAASRAGKGDAYRHSEIRLANAWQWLSRAEEYFDRTDYLLALEMVALAGTTAFMALDLVAWEADGDRGVELANTRWKRLDPVKEWAFQQRRESPQGDRAPVIRRILGEVKERAKAAGEPLSGDESAVISTVTSWFRKAKIS